MYIKWTENNEVGIPKFHFVAEEGLLREANYDELEEHISLHKALIKQMSEKREEAISSQDPEIALSFLKQWWLSHINSEDRKYVADLKNSLGIS
jgi:hemerythrin